jgi:hypothetical protein
MGAMTRVKLDIEFDDGHDAVRLRHPVYRPTCITDAIPSVRKRMNFVGPTMERFAGWTRVAITMGHKTIVIRPV